MATTTQSSAVQKEIDRFVKGVQRRNRGEKEFLQAVQEVAESLMPFILENTTYKEARILERLTEPDRIIIFRVTWMDDKGRYRVNRGYRVQNSNAIGPYKGGLRFHPSVNLSILKFLAFEQTLKNSLTTLHMGGAKGGSDFNPKGKSNGEVMRFCQSFMTCLWKHIGEDTDIPAGDIGVGPREIGYLYGQYLRLANEQTAAITGKGISFGGSYIRKEATGFGCVYFAEEMLNRVDDSVVGKTCVVSGAGNVAQHTIEKLIQLGAKVITASDSTGFIHDPDGIDDEKLQFLMSVKNERRASVSEYAQHYGCEFHEDARPWAIPCHIAFPCATQNEINAKDAQTLINNGLVALVEGANMPSDHEAVQLFRDANILYAPSKAANAGGVAVSGLEQTQNVIRMSWTAEEVDTKLKAIMHDIHEQCALYGQDGSHVDYLKGANLAGFVRVADALLAFGVI